MRKVGDVTRVRLNLWVRVRLRTGEVVEGYVKSHHDHHPHRHTICDHGDNLRIVEFPKDEILKISRHPFKAPVVPVEKPKPVKPKPEPAAPVRKAPPKEKTPYLNYAVTFISGAILGVIGATLYHLNVVLW